MSDKMKAALTIAAVTAAAVLILTLIAGIGSLATHAGFLLLLQRLFSAAGGVVLLLAGFRFFTYRSITNSAKENSDKPHLLVTAGLLTIGTALVLLACLVDYICI